MSVQQEHRDQEPALATAQPVAVNRTNRILRAAWEPGVTLLIGIGAILYAGQASYSADYVMLICTYALLALGMYVPYIMSGGLSLAYNAYLGIGAYSCGLIAMHTQWSSVWGLPIGFVLSAMVAVLLGMVTRKLSGFYLAGVTLLF
ncbi:MAG: branched-chain amino acid transport system permease protein, partial [Micromonosporaceae bacterium]|nr:branched-chain amino acid transport system permease protein [Micromonosporaceae bacterium]